MALVTITSAVIVSLASALFPINYGPGHQRAQAKIDDYVSVGKEVLRGISAMFLVVDQVEVAKDAVEYERQCQKKLEIYEWYLYSPYRGHNSVQAVTTPSSCPETLDYTPSWRRLLNARNNERRLAHKINQWLISTWIATAPAPRWRVLGGVGWLLDDVKALEMNP